MRVVIADDHAMFATALRYLLQASDPEIQVEPVNSIAEALDRLDPPPSLFLLDYDMPEVNGITGLEMIRARAPEVNVAILSGVTDASLIRLALDKGAIGWLPKTMPPEALIHSLRMMANGQRFIPAEILATAEVGPGLSEREAQVGLLLARGSTDKAIADALGIEPSTVKVHVRRILKKSGAANRSQFAAMARRL